MTGIDAGLATGLGLAAAAILVPLLLGQVLLAAYRGAEPAAPSGAPRARRLRIGAALLLVVFGAGAVLRVLQILNR